MRECRRGFFFLPPTGLVNFFPRPNYPLFFLFKMAAWATDGNIHLVPPRFRLYCGLKYEEDLILVGGWGEGSRTPCTLPLDPPLNPVVFFARISEGCAQLFCWYFSIADNVFFFSDIIRVSFTSIYHWIDGRVNTLRHYGSYLHQIPHMHFNLIWRLLRALKSLQADTK